MIRIDTSSFIPFYEQVNLHLERRIRAGVLRPRDPLPSIRDMAASLLLSPNTVARAYRELERKGLIVTRKGKGCFVADGAARLSGKPETDSVERLIDELVREAESLGIPHDKVKGILDQRLRLGGRKRRERNKP